MTIEFKHLLVPVDFGEPSQRALAAGVDLARRFGSQLTLVHVCEIPAYVYGGMTYATADLIGPIEEAARETLDKALRGVKDKLPATTGILRRGPAAMEILGVISELRVDLVVIGTHGHKGLKHAFLGSVAERIVRLSPVPVLTMHESKAR
jgi:nucleotide-binding universal stress UspA family protein